MIYINGIEQELWPFTPPAGSASDNTGDNLNIGKALQTNNTTFKGTIDEARIWNLIRNQNEIETNMGHYLAGDENGLVGYWKMNEGNGDVIEDFSPQNNAGSLTGAGWCQGKNLLSPVSINNSENPGNDPVKVKLHPNPFESSTTIDYNLIYDGPVKIVIYDSAGKQLLTLVEEFQMAGKHQLYL